MMMRNRVVAFVCAFLLGPLFGCVSLKRTDEARFFVLRAQAPPSASGDLREARSGLVGLMPVRLPGYLNRPQLVVQDGPNQVLVDEFVRWAEPLEPALTRVVAENLAALLTDRQVVRSPFPAGATLRCRVAIEIESFAPQKNGEVRLEGRWTLVAPADARALVRREFRLRRGPVPLGPGGVVDAAAGTAAMSELLLDLAAQIAEGTRTLDGQ